MRRDDGKRSKHMKVASVVLLLATSPIDGHYDAHAYKQNHCCLSWVVLGHSHGVEATAATTSCPGVIGKVGNTRENLAWKPVTFTRAGECCCMPRERAVLCHTLVKYQSTSKHSKLGRATDRSLKLLKVWIMQGWKGSKWKVCNCASSWSNFSALYAELGCVVDSQ